jgi:hypothetical protein
VLAYIAPETANWNTISRLTHRFQGGRKRQLPALRRFVPVVRPLLEPSPKRCVFFDRPAPEAGRQRFAHRLVRSITPLSDGFEIVERLQRPHPGDGHALEDRRTITPFATASSTRTGSTRTCGRAITTRRSSPRAHLPESNRVQRSFRVNAQGSSTSQPAVTRPRIVIGSGSASRSRVGKWRACRSVSTVLDLAQPRDFLSFDRPTRPCRHGEFHRTSQGFDADAQQALQRAVVAWLVGLRRPQQLETALTRALRWKC